jgi:WD40 repeat protein
MNADAFLSYSHGADAVLGPWFERAIERVAKPWYRRRGLNVFRDQTSLSTSPDLWASIEAALDDATCLILLASPEAGQSPWVNREIEHWRATKSAASISLVVTAGAIAWDPVTGDFAKDSTAVPPALRGAFAHEPLWIDMRDAADPPSMDDPTCRRAVTGVAAAVRGVDRDELDAEDLRQHRRSIRLAWVAGTTLGALAVAAVAASLLAVNRSKEANSQRTEAESQRKTASARELARRARAEPDPHRAVALAVAAEFATNTPLPEARSAFADASRRQSQAVLLPTPSLVAHEGDVTDVAWSHDGTRIASAGQDSVIHVWDSASGRMLGKSLTVDRGSVVHAVRWSPDGTLLASASDDGVRVSNAMTSQLLWSTVGSDFSQAWSVAWAPDGHRLAMADQDTFSIRDAMTGAKQLDGRADRNAVADPGFGVTAVAWSRDGSHLATGDRFGHVTIWDAATLRQPKALNDLATLGARVNSVVWSPDGKRIASGASDGTVTLWDAVTGAASSAPMSLNSAAVTALSWSTDGRTLAGAAGLGIVLWDPDKRVQDGEPLVGHAGSVLTISWSPDDTHLVSGGSDGKIRVWKRSPTAPRDNAFATPSGVEILSVAWSPAARQLAAGETRIHIWTSSATARQLGDFLEVGSTFLAWAPDGKRLARADASGVVEMFDVSTGRSEWARSSAVRPPADDTGAEGVDLIPTALTALAWSPNGRLLVGAGKQGTLEVWEAMNGTPTIGPITAHSGPTDTVAWSPDSASVASGGADGSIKLWDPMTGSMTKELSQAHAGAVRTVVWSPNGTLLASGGSDGVVRLWSAATYHVVSEVRTSAEVDDIAWSPDGSRLAGALENGTIEIWDPASAQPLIRPMSGHVGRVHSIAWSNDGTVLASGGRDGTVRLWTGRSEATACELAATALGPEVLREITNGIDSMHSCLDGVNLPRLPVLPVDETTEWPAT